MNNLLNGAAVCALSVCICTEAAATEWNVSVWGKRRAFTEHVEKLAELVSEKTNGEFTLNVSYGGLSKNTENLDGISIGAFEMAQFCAGYHADKNPSITVLELPFLGVRIAGRRSRGLQGGLCAPRNVADLARWNATLLMPSPMPQYNIVGVGDAPTTLADFEGLTVRATGGIGEALTMIGAVPTSVTSDEARQAHGFRHREVDRLCAARAYVVWHDGSRQVVDRKPQPRHGELPGRGQHRRAGRADGRRARGAAGIG